MYFLASFCFFYVIRQQLAQCFSSSQRRHWLTHLLRSILSYSDTVEPIGVAGHWQLHVACRFAVLVVRTCVSDCYRVSFP